VGYSISIYRLAIANYNIFTIIDYLYLSIAITSINHYFIIGSTCKCCALLFSLKGVFNVFFQKKIFHHAGEEEPNG